MRGSLDAQTGSSRLICRVLPMNEPPSIYSNELTDKGYTNQCAALTPRAALVQLLHAEPPGPELIVIEA